MKQFASDEQKVNEIKRIVVKSKGKISPPDASAATGYSIEEIKDGLTRLIELYECRVTMAKDTGALLFVFSYPLRQKGSKSLREYMFIALGFLWKVFQVIYKAAIGIILIFYTVAFILLLLAILFGGGNRDRDSRGGGAMLAGLFRAIFEGMTWAAWFGAVEHVTDRQGYHYRRYVPEKKKEKNFIQSVFHFVFGPERPKYDPLADAREAAAFIRKNKGRLTAGQIVVLTGVDYDEAERRLADYAVRYKGDLSIDENGLVVAEFHDLMQSMNPELEGGKIEFYIDEIDAPYQLTGNSSGRNTAIALMNGFNLLMSLFSISFFSNHPDLSSLVYVAGYFPLVYSILFYLIPLLRMPYISYKTSHREISVMRKKLVSGFITSPDERMTFDDILRKGRIESGSQTFAKNIMDKLVIELQGEVALREDGAAAFTFPRLSRELVV